MYYINPHWDPDSGYNGGGLDVSISDRRSEEVTGLGHRGLGAGSEEDSEVERFQNVRTLGCGIYRMVALRLNHLVKPSPRQLRQLHLRLLAPRSRCLVGSVRHRGLSHGSAGCPALGLHGQATESEGWSRKMTHRVRRMGKKRSVNQDPFNFRRLESF